VQYIAHNKGGVCKKYYCAIMPRRLEVKQYLVNCKGQMLMLIHRPGLCYVVALGHEFARCDDVIPATSTACAKRGCGSWRVRGSGRPGPWAVILPPFQCSSPPRHTTPPWPIRPHVSCLSYLLPQGAIAELEARVRVQG